MLDQKARQIALLLQAIDDIDMERAEFMTDYKERRTRLENELGKVKRDVLSGQMTLTEVLREKLPEIERDLNANSPDNKVTLSITEDGPELQPAGD